MGAPDNQVQTQNPFLFFLKGYDLIALPTGMQFTAFWWLQYFIGTIVSAVVCLVVLITVVSVVFAVCTLIHLSLTCSLQYTLYIEE